MPLNRTGAGLAALALTVPVLISACTVDTSTGGGAGGAGPDQEKTVTPGDAFRLGDFAIKKGWRIKKGLLGYDVKNLTVVNRTDSSHTFLVDVRLLNGNKQVADITCSTDEAKPGRVLDVTCIPDGKKPYKKVTFANTF